MFILFTCLLYIFKTIAIFVKRNVRLLRAGRHGGAWFACCPVFRICVRHAAAVRDGAASGGRMGSGTAAVCRNIGAGRYPRLPTVRRRKNIIYMGMEKKRLPKTCPACGSVLRVRSMYCHACDTQIVGDYMLPPLMRLTEEEQRFVADFVMCSGSLKEMAARMGVSYPSVRNRLDEIIGELRRAVAADMSDE